MVPYAFWSNISPSLMCGFDIRVEDIDYPHLRKLFAYWRQIIPNYYGDFYPLSGHSTAPDAWMAWQFNRPETGEGLVQAFIRPEAPILGLRLKLQDLVPDAAYEITRYGSDEKTTMTGKELISSGLKIYMDTSPEAVVITYKMVRDP